MKNFKAYLAAILMYQSIAVGSLALAQSESTLLEKTDSTAEASDLLQAYLDQSDDSYQWKQVREGEIGNVQYAELILQSQVWRNIPWKHQLFIFKPATSTHCHQALLYVGGQVWREECEDPAFEPNLSGRLALLADLAHRLETPVAVLQQVPQQPMFGGMVEDAIIAYTFHQFLATGESDWPLLLPMVKSAVRGMDAVQQFCLEEWQMEVETFTVTGASKRGWTTWLVGANDKRVNSIAPMVIDVLNMAPQMDHQLSTWGKFSEEIGDYTARGLQKVLNTPSGEKLTSTVDPYAYRDSLELPKIIINGTNDRYWPVDALNLYWDDLPGEKYALYVPNEGHGIRDKLRLVGAVAALQRHACGAEPLPEPTWKYENGAGGLSLHVDSDRKMQTCQFWMAESEDRDFRDARWRMKEANQDTKASQFEVAKPTSGYVAVFGEMIYDAKHFPLHLSTNLRVVGEED